MATDTVKTRVQAGTVRGKYLDAWAVVYSQHGARGFYLGYLPILCRAVPVNASSYFVIELCNSTLAMRRDNQPRP